MRSDRLWDLRRRLSGWGRFFMISGKSTRERKLGCRATHFKRRFEAFSGAPDHEQPVGVDLHPVVDPVHALQQGAVHVERQAAGGDAEGHTVPRSVTQTAHWEPGEDII